LPWGKPLTLHISACNPVARKSPNRVFIPIFITGIFLLVVTQCVVQWLLATWNFLWDQSINTYFAIFFPPQVLQVLNIVTYALLVGASSTLLVRFYNVQWWMLAYRLDQVFRAYSVVGMRYKRLRALMAFFYSSQNGIIPPNVWYTWFSSLACQVLLISSVIASGVATSSQESQGPLANNLTAGMTFLGAATTSLAGIIIACRVPFPTNNRECIGFWQIFTYIMDVFIQSAIACPIMLLISAVSIALPADNLPTDPSLFSFITYSFALVVIATVSTFCSAFNLGRFNSNWRYRH